MYRGPVTICAIKAGIVLIATLLQAILCANEAVDGRSADSTEGFVLDPGLLEPSELSLRPVTQVSHAAPPLFDPLQLQTDEIVIAAERRMGAALNARTWEGSIDVLATQRLDEDINIDGRELGTGVASGVRIRLENRLDAPSDTLNGWDVIVVDFRGEENMEPIYPLYIKSKYAAALTSVESNVIIRSEYKRRIRKQFIGIRFVDQNDSMEIWAPWNHTYVATRLDTHNRMLGLQLGMEQNWNLWQRVSVGCGLKAGQYYSRVQGSAFSYDSGDAEFPRLYEYHASLGIRVLENAQADVGLLGMLLEKQRQTRFAWQSPEEADAFRYIGVRLGFNFNY